MGAAWVCVGSGVLLVDTGVALAGIVPVGPGVEVPVLVGKGVCVAIVGVRVGDCVGPVGVLVITGVGVRVVMLLHVVSVETVIE